MEVSYLYNNLATEEVNRKDTCVNNESGTTPIHDSRKSVELKIEDVSVSPQEAQPSSVSDSELSNGLQHESQEDSSSEAFSEEDCDDSIFDEEYPCTQQIEKWLRDLHLPQEYLSALIGILSSQGIILFSHGSPT